MSGNELTNMVFTTLVIRGKNLVPQEVTEVIGIVPTKSFKRGDIRNGDKKWPHGYWELESKNFVESVDLAVHLEWLAAKLEPSKAELVKLIGQEGIDAELSCFWILPSSYESLSLSADLLRCLASLGVRIQFDVYCSIETA